MSLPPQIEIALVSPGFSVTSECGDAAMGKVGTQLMFLSPHFWSKFYVN